MGVTVRDQGRRVLGSLSVGRLTVAGLYVTGGMGGDAWFVDPVSGVNTNSGKSANRAFLTMAKALTKAGSNDTVYMLPGQSEEAALTIAATQKKLAIIGLGGRGAAYIKTSTANGTTLTNHADDVTLVNVGLEGIGTGGGLLNTGQRLRAYASKIEGGSLALDLSMGTVAQIAAATRGKGADLLFDDCEIAWATTGVKLTGTDYGAVTQARFRRCLFHNLSAASFEEATGASGEASIRFRDLEVSDSTFMGMEDGTAPTAYMLLNDNNSNTGLVTRSSFPTALAGGLNLVSTNVDWVCNYHTGGVSTGQPS